MSDQPATHGSDRDAGARCVLGSSKHDALRHRFLWQGKQVLDAAPETARQREGDRRVRHVPSRLDRADGLARETRAIGDLELGETTGVAQISKPIRGARTGHRWGVDSSLDVRYRRLIQVMQPYS